MNQLLTHYKELNTGFNYYFIMSRESLEIENIHKLRVHIKKLKAILSLIQIISEQKYLKKQHLQLIDSLFISSGCLRENQLINLAIIHYDSVLTESYIKSLLNENERLENNLSIELEIFDLESWNRQNNIVKKLILEFSEVDIQKKTLIYISKKLKKIRELREKNLTNKRVHKIRTHLKRLFEVTRFLYGISPSPELESFRIKIDNLADVIGNWHDQDVLMLSMMAFMHKNESSQLTRITEKIDQENEKIKANIIEELEEIMNSKDVLEWEN